MNKNYMDDMDINNAISYGMSKLGFTDITSDQRSITKAYLQGKDAFFCSPTGSGKSLTFELAPLAFDFLSKNSETIDPMVIVISPLSSLMKNQVQILHKRGVKAVYLKDTSAEGLDGEFEPTLRNLIERSTQIIFGSPETLLGKNRTILKQLAPKNAVKAIFVDEAHCIKKYGISNDKKKSAYRPHYGQLGEIRSLFGTAIPVIALTATASPETKGIIVKELCLINMVDITRMPDKTNITYWIQEILTGNTCDHFEWLVNLLLEHNISTPRMIIFFRQIKHISEVYEHLISRLGMHAYVDYKMDGPNDDRNRLFDMFHLKTDDEVKDSICSSYQNPDGNIRVVLSSTSFSMGLDVKGVDYVLHYGPANDIDDYVQETGRAGRNMSTQCHAVLLKYKRCLSSKNISKPMKDYVKSNNCRRQEILQFFGFSAQTTTSIHSCCDVCFKLCKCNCKCVKECMCETDKTCIGNIPSLISAIRTTEFENSESESADNSDSDMELLSRRPQVIQSSSDSN